MLQGPGEQPNLVVDGTGIVLKGGDRLLLGAAEQTADHSVEDTDRLVRQPCRGPDHGDDQDRPPAARRQSGEMLRC